MNMGCIKRWAVAGLAVVVLALGLGFPLYANTVQPYGNTGGGGTVTSVTAGTGAGGGVSVANGTTTPVISVAQANLAQPVMFVGASAAKTSASATTTGTINTPSGVLNGDLEIVVLQLNNTTSSAFVPPSGWTAITSCAASGNTVQNQAFQHIASSEGATIAAFTWATANAAFQAWATAWRNTSGVGACVANTAASGTSITTTGLTAGSVNDRIIAIGGEPSSGGYIINTSTPTGVIGDTNYVNNTVYGEGEYSYPITSTTVAGFQISTANSISAAWAGLQMDLTYASSTTAGPPGAETFNQLDGFMASLVVSGGMSMFSTGVGGVEPVSIFDAGLGTMSNRCLYATTDGFGRFICALSISASGTQVGVGDSSQNNNNGTIVMNEKTQFAGAITTTTNSVSSTTGAIGPTGGGVLQSYGGTAPTCSTATGTCVVAAPANCTGSAAPWPNCSGSGAGTLKVSTNSSGEMHITGGTALTSATLTFSASGPWNAIPSCSFSQAGANATPLAYSAPLGGCASTSACVVTFVSASAADIVWKCN